MPARALASWRRAAYVAAMSLSPPLPGPADSALAAPALDRLAPALEEVMEAAGALALSMFATDLKTWTKGNNSPVTEADLAVNRLLQSRLTALDPAIGWLSEESVDSPDRLSARRLWVVDPIDGTRGFMAGSPDWAISVALVEDGAPALAALFAPVSAELFLARRGHGATRNGSLLRITARDALSGARAAGPAPSLDRLARAAEIVRLPRGRSLALRLARVATGEIDIGIAGDAANDWDLAAADLIASEAGGSLTTFTGAPVRYNAPVPRHPPLVCAGRGLHPAAVAALRADP